MRSLVGILFLLFIQSPCCLGCVVPSGQQWLVTGLENQLMNSINHLCSPNPSALIALNLAKNQDVCVPGQLLQQIKDTAAQEMTSGKVALYVLALRSSCENPREVVTPNGKINLVQILEDKTREETESYKKRSPKTTFYQLALDALALCFEESPDIENVAGILVKAANDLQLREAFSVDTAAVVSLALVCVYDDPSSNNLREKIPKVLKLLIDHILEKQQENGIIGNIYSTGLAIQALSVTSQFWSQDRWNCTKTLNKVLQEAYLGAFNNPNAISQILPSLVGKTYLDVKNLQCLPVNPIRVNYTIINHLIGLYFEHSIIIDVPPCSVLLDVLEAAKRDEPREFSFKTKETCWGPMVISINDIKADENEKTYWQFLSGNKPLDQGVGSYKPSNNENIVAIFSKY
ncbi:cobalamin binding intrinsic factor isoform X2 [Pogona vitticeps]